MLKESSRNAGSFLMVMIEKKNDKNVRSNAEKTRTFGYKSCELQCLRT